MLVKVSASPGAIRTFYERTGHIRTFTSIEGLTVDFWPAKAIRKAELIGVGNTVFEKGRLII